jgi:UPF0716 protein FxsA
MPILLLLFVGVPAIELWLLIEIGSVIGGAETILLILVTGVLGASLARAQGLAVLERIRSETAAGRLPDRSLAEAALILAAGMLLITPGVITDAIGLLCLVPLTRRLFLIVLARLLARAARQQARGPGGSNVKVHMHFGGGGPAARGQPDPRRGPQAPVRPPGPGPAIKDLSDEDFEVRSG